VGKREKRVFVILCEFLAAASAPAQCWVHLNSMGLLQFFVLAHLLLDHCNYVSSILNTQYP